MGCVGAARRPRDGAPGSRRPWLRRSGRAAPASSARGRASGRRVGGPQRAIMLLGTAERVEAGWPRRRWSEARRHVLGPRPATRQHPPVALRLTNQMRSGTAREIGVGPRSLTGWTAGAHIPAVCNSRRCPLDEGREHYMQQHYGYVRVRLHFQQPMRGNQRGSALRRRPAVAPARPRALPPHASWAWFRLSDPARASRDVLAEAAKDQLCSSRVACFRLPEPETVARDGKDLGRWAVAHLAGRRRGSWAKIRSVRWACRTRCRAPPPGARYVGRCPPKRWSRARSMTRR